MLRARWYHSCQSTSSMMESPSPNLDGAWPSQHQSTPVSRSASNNAPSYDQRQSASPLLAEYPQLPQYPRFWDSDSEMSVTWALLMPEPEYTALSLEVDQILSAQRSQSESSLSVQEGTDLRPPWGQQALRAEDRADLKGHGEAEAAQEEEGEEQDEDAGQNSHQQTVNAANTTNVSSLPWNSSITNPVQARAWLLANSTHLERVAPKDDDVTAEIPNLAAHAQVLFNALYIPSQAPESSWKQHEVDYYQTYQANAVSKLNEISSTAYGCSMVQSQCFLAIEMAYDLHTVGIEPSLTKMQLDDDLKLSERISRMIDCVNMKSVALSIAEGKADVMENLARNPIALLAMRKDGAKNNSGKQRKNKAGAKALANPTNVSGAANVQPLPAQHNAAINLSGSATSLFGSSFSTPASGYSAHTSNSSTSNLQASVLAQDASGDDRTTYSTKRVREATENPYDTATNVPSSKRHRRRDVATDSGYATPTTDDQNVQSHSRQSSNEQQFQYPSNSGAGNGYGMPVGYLDQPAAPFAMPSFGQQSFQRRSSPSTQQQGVEVTENPYSPTRNTYDDPHVRDNSGWYRGEG